MPLFRRFDRPGLLDSVAPSAIVGGTETMRARAVDRGATTPSGVDVVKREKKTAPPGAGPVSPQLGMLSSLHDSGAISDVEFVKATKRVLGA